MHAKPQGSLLALSFGLVLLVAFAFQGSRGLWEPDEGTFGTVAAEMYDSGNWLVPTLHHDPYPEKPPLLYWGMTAGMKVLGRNEWGARAFPALCLVLSAWLTGLLAAAMWGGVAAPYAMLIFGTMVIPAAACNISRPDAPLLLAATLALYCFWMSLYRARPTLWKMAMCAAFGLGVLAKGPAVLVFAAPMFVYLLIRGRAFSYFVTPWAIVGAVIFAAVGLSWFYFLIQHVPGSKDYFWHNEVVGRLVKDTYKRNPGIVGALNMYGPVLLLGHLPWSLFWPYWLLRMKPAVTTLDWWRGLLNRPAALLLLLWVLLPVLVFSLASSKLPLYVLPVFPVFALATARAWMLHPPFPRIQFPAVATAAAILLIVLKGGSAYYWTDDKDSRALWREISTQIPPRCRTLYSFEEKRNGLAFYSTLAIVDTAIKPDEVAEFVLPEKFDSVLAELKTSGASNGIVVQSKRAKQIRTELERRSIPFREIETKLHQTLFLCNVY